MIFDLFSRRQKRADVGGVQEVYRYDTVPVTLKVQLQQIFQDAIGPQSISDRYAMHIPRENAEAWRFINKTLCREKGVHSLGSGYLEIEKVMNFIGKTDTAGFLDATELCAKYIYKVITPMTEGQRGSLGICQEPEEALNEINYRMKEAAFGYQIEEGELFRIDSEFVHEEAVKPALRILAQQGFEGPKDEFLKAHTSYRAGDYSKAIGLAANSFESTLKVVCDRNGWQYSQGARASDLLKVVRKHNLWPDYLDASFDQLLATLSSGLPKVRNDSSAHGQGATVRQTPSYIASYALHLAAAKITLMAEAQS